MMFDFMTTLSRGFHSSKVMYLVLDLEQVSLWFLLCALSFCFAEKEIPDEGQWGADKKGGVS